ncbi:MAG: efflux RND transporter periplasmic adaptor subunit [Cellvibrionales bacterium]|nr:efflux RND transporter periplasmic adaptor subunit [Cellvibrionales bacterium]
MLYRASLFCLCLPCLFTAFFLSSCCQDSEQKPSATKVKVALSQHQQYKQRHEFVGRLEAVNDANILAQVSGYLVSADFIEGDIVEQEALLFLIEPSSYQAELAAAKASVAQTKALEEEAKLNYSRGKRLIVKGAISQSEMDRLTSNLHSTEANVKAAMAKQQAAQVNLGHTRITAPFKGRVGKKNVAIGDLVGPSNPEPLTTLVSIDPIYATFQVDAKIYNAAMKVNREARAAGKPIPTFTVYIRLSNGALYDKSGKIDFISNRIDAEMDSIMIRGRFDNPEGVLRPGQYVKVDVEADQSITVLTVPQAAIISNQEGEQLFVVDAEGKVQKLMVETGENIGQDVIVESDQLKPGMQVIIAGVQKVKNGQMVQIIKGKEKVKDQSKP